MKGGRIVNEFEQIYREHFGDVYRYILNLSRDEHIAEEITAETFFSALKSIDKFRGDCEIRVWLCQIAKHCYLSYLRRVSHSRDFSDDELTRIPDLAEPPDERAANRDEAARVRAILHRLPEQYREVFMWRVFAELSFKQIGEIFGKSENWACVTYHRARVRILEELEGKV